MSEIQEHIKNLYKNTEVAEESFSKPYLSMITLSSWE